MALLDEIKAKCPAALIASHDTAAIAAKVSEGRVRLVPTRIVAQDVLDTLGAEEGAAVVDAIRGMAPPDGTTAARRKLRPLAYAVDFLTSTRGLDVANAQTRAQLDGLVTAQAMTQAQADKLKALAERPDPVTEYDVRRAMLTDDGRWLA